MTEAFLKMLREESNKAISILKNNNENNSLIQEKVKNRIMAAIYARHIGEIDEEDTNQIYYYDGTYKYVYDSSLEEYGLGPVEERVDRDNLEADFRRYSNVEGIYSYRIGLEEADEFEKTHTVIYSERADMEAGSLWEISDDFVITAIKDGQEQAKSFILKKYNTGRK